MLLPSHFHYDYETRYKLILFIDYQHMSSMLVMDINNNNKTAMWKIITYFVEFIVCIRMNCRFTIQWRLTHTVFLLK